MQVNENVSVYLSSTGYFKSHYSQSDVSFVKCMILCYIFLEALYVCVEYIMVGVTK